MILGHGGADPGDLAAAQAPLPGHHAGALRPGRRSTCTIWGFGVPFLLAGAWYLVRAYRLQQALKRAEAGRGAARVRRAATEPRPRRGPAANKRYTPPHLSRARRTAARRSGCGGVTSRRVTSACRRCRHQQPAPTSSEQDHRTGWRARRRRPPTSARCRPWRPVTPVPDRPGTAMAADGRPGPVEVVAGQLLDVAVAVERCTSRGRRSPPQLLPLPPSSPGQLETVNVTGDAVVVEPVGPAGSCARPTTVKTTTSTASVASTRPTTTCPRRRGRCCPRRRPEQRRPGRPARASRTSGSPPPVPSSGAEGRCGHHDRGIVVGSRGPRPSRLLGTSARCQTA